MDIYEQTLTLLLDLPPIHVWPEMESLIRRSTAPRPSHWKLPFLACEALGQPPERAIPAIASMACMQISILLVDDLLDQDPRGEHNRIGAAAASNLASAFQAAGQQVIARCDAAPAAKLHALDSLSQMMLTTAHGQYIDGKNPSDEATYWWVIRTKSSPFFGAALQIGGLLSGAPLALAAQLRQLGDLFGEIVQIHDDLSDTMAAPANPDWLMGRSPLPVIFAQVVDHPGRQRFLELRADVQNPENLVEAQTILLRCGAVSYCIDQALFRYKKALELLKTIRLNNPDRLEAGFEDLIRPIWGLFARLGVDQSRLLSRGETSGAGGSVAIKPD